jgi:hypothetical protein
MLRASNKNMKKDCSIRGSYACCHPLLRSNGVCFVLCFRVFLLTLVNCAASKDEKVVFCAIGLGFVEASQDVVVVKQFEKRVHIMPLGLEFLRHGGQDDFALVNGAEVECAFTSAKHLGDFWSQKVLEITAP